MIKIWSEGPSGDGMSEAVLVESLALVRAHPWWHARARLAISLLEAEGLSAPCSIIDIGCGWGVNLQALESAGYRASGLDASKEILELIDQPQRALFLADLTQPLLAEHETYDGGLMLDVLEHLDDDRASLNRVADLLRPGGSLIVSVPALPELFSEYDEIQGHRRRYTAEALRAAFDGTGLRLKHIYWWGAWMVRVLKATRKKQRSAESAPKTYAQYLRLPPWPVPWAMRALHAIENWHPVLSRLTTGTSLIAVATREG